MLQKHLKCVAALPCTIFKVLRPTQYKIGHFGDALLSQSIDQVNKYQRK